MSSCDESLSSPIRPVFTSTSESVEAPAVQKLIAELGLLKHPEGGYFVETDRDPLRVPNPFQSKGASPPTGFSAAEKLEEDSTRSASTTIYYLLTPAAPKGNFHRNKGRTVHTLHKGRGRYVLIHADEKQDGHKARIETFLVGQDIHRGERLQWIVKGGKYKASFLLPDADGKGSSEGLLISEVRIPVAAIFQD
jgi:predicted cupin superfamily sugar epimerase